MSRFTATTSNEAVVPADRQAIWKAITDPDLLPRLTPYLRSISVDGEHWRWEMTSIPVLSETIVPRFTERMSFDEQRAIEFTHDPPEGVRERAAAEGWYRLEDAEEGTRLSIRIELTVDVPLPRASKRAVVAVMNRVMDRMGDKFAANLLTHLGVG